MLAIILYLSAKAGVISLDIIVMSGLISMHHVLCKGEPTRPLAKYIDDKHHYSVK